MPFLDVEGVRIHHEVVEGPIVAPALVFLHDGLGSVELWRQFPRRLSEATGHAAVVYSREGHGWSDASGPPRSADFMEHEATVVLPRILERLEIEHPVLVGHSDGASISLVHAATHPVTAVVAIAPHVFVEPESLRGADTALEAFETGDMASRMARYHRDPHSTFRNWYDLWSSPAFEDWTIEHVLGGVDRPVLLVQGGMDAYGTVAQLDAIESQVGGDVERLWLEECGHAPHLERPDLVADAVVEFVGRYGRTPFLTGR
jgi:pimeloyl-ACP methyl ester carboxylesterase